MIKPYHYAIFLLATTLSTNALATCKKADRVKGNTTPTLAAVLTENTICGTEGGGATFQEEHRTSSLSNNFMELWDYKEGSSSLSDPTSRIGKWKITNNGNKVRYRYQPGLDTYNYTVHTTGNGVYDFCTGNGSTEVVSVTIVNGIGSGC